MILLSGTSNEALTQKIARLLHVPLAKREITRFIDNECRVYIQEKVENEQIFVLQSLSEVADQHLVELCLIGQALKSLKASHVTAVIPWMGYSKQDKEFRKGEAVSAQLVAKFIESAGFDHVITIELHSENVVPFFHIPVQEVSSRELLAQTLRKQSRLSLERTCVVSPDTGGKSRSARFARLLNLPIVYLEKDRDKASGKVVVSGIKGEVRYKNIVIFDDIINTGATAIKTSQFLKNKGALNIYFLATHAVLAGDACMKLQLSAIDSVIVTDTIHISQEKYFKKLAIVSIASLLADAISRGTR